MVQIDAFRGIRYDLGHVGALGNVIAPPYDVIDDDLRDQLYELHTANVIRLILNRAEPGTSRPTRTIPGQPSSSSSGCVRGFC